MTNEMTPEQIQAEKEAKREMSLKYLKDKGIQGLATAYFVENGQGEGERDKNLVERFMYKPAMKSGFAQDVIYNEFQATRHDNPDGTKKRYSGTASEFNIIKRASNIYTGSLADVTVGDVVALSGSKIEVDEAYKNAYLGDLLDSEDEAVKKIGTQIMGTYLGYFVDNQVSKVRTISAKQSRTALENIVKKQEE